MAILVKVPFVVCGTQQNFDTMALELATVTWQQLIEDIFQKKTKKEELAQAITFLQKEVGFMEPGDAVGADDRELAAVKEKWSALSAAARTVAKRGVGGANALYEAERSAKRRKLEGSIMVDARPPATAGGLAVMMEDTVKAVAGRETSAAVIAAALRADSATTWKKAELLKASFGAGHLNVIRN